MRILKVQVNGPLSKTKRGGNKLEYLEKTLDNQSESWYRILEVNIHHPSNPHPLTLMTSSLGQNALALTQ